MKINILNINGMYVVRTGRVLVYEQGPNPVFDEEGVVVDFGDEYSFSDEVVDVITGIHYGLDGWLIHTVGTPTDTYVSGPRRNKRGRHSRSNNKKANRHRAYVEWLGNYINEVNKDLPF